EFHDAIADLPGSLRARQLVVKRAAEYLDDLAGEAQDDVGLQRELATAYERLATILGGGGVSNLGDARSAEAHYRSALAIRERLAARRDAQPADVDGLAQLHVELSRTLAATNTLDRAETEAASAVALLQSPRAGAAATPGRLGHMATAFHQLGYVQG